MAGKNTSIAHPLPKHWPTTGILPVFFLERAGKANWAHEFRCLKDEQKQLRKKARFWWKNVFCSESNCKCPNLRGREFDILVVYERTDGERLALHIECKNPDDRFSEGQAHRYRERLACWTLPGHGPQTIPQHRKAVALLICSRTNKFCEEDLAQFNGIVYFDEIAAFLTPYPEPSQTIMPT